MTTYVQKKSRVFKEAGEPQPLLPKRSEGRLKRYPSATDARAWTVENEPRRQHILDMLLQKSDGLNLGRYIPLEVLINTLLANKDADIERLKKQLDELQKLLQAYESLELTPEQKNQLKKLKQQLGVASDNLSSKSGSRSGRTGPPPPTEATDELDEKMDIDTECAANAASEGVPPCESLTMEDLEGLSEEELKRMLIKKDQELNNLRNALAILVSGLEPRRVRRKCQRFVHCCNGHLRAVLKMSLATVDETLALTPNSTRFQPGNQDLQLNYDWGSLHHRLSIYPSVMDIYRRQLSRCNCIHREINNKKSTNSTYQNMKKEVSAPVLYFGTNA